MSGPRTPLGEQALIYFGFRRRQLNPAVTADPDAARLARYAATSHESGFGWAGVAMGVRLLWTGTTVPALIALVLACLSWLAGFALIASAHRAVGLPRPPYLTEATAGLVVLAVAVVVIVARS